MDAIDNFGAALGKSSGTPVVITENNFAIKAENVDTASLVKETFTVAPGSPVARFPEEITLQLPNSIHLVLANIKSATIGVGSQTLRISGQLFSISTGSVKITGLRDCITLLFPKVEIMT